MWQSLLHHWRFKFSQLPKHFIYGRCFSACTSNITWMYGENGQISCTNTDLVLNRSSTLPSVCCTLSNHTTLRGIVFPTLRVKMLDKKAVPTIDVASSTYTTLTTKRLSCLISADNNWIIKSKFYFEHINLFPWYKSNKCFCIDFQSSTLRFFYEF